MSVVVRARHVQVDQVARRDPRVEIALDLLPDREISAVAPHCKIKLMDHQGPLVVKALDHRGMARVLVHHRDRVGRKVVDHKVVALREAAGRRVGVDLIPIGCLIGLMRMVTIN